MVQHQNTVEYSHKNYVLGADRHILNVLYKRSHFVSKLIHLKMIGWRSLFYVLMSDKLEVTCIIVIYAYILALLESKFLNGAALLVKNKM